MGFVEEVAGLRFFTFGAGSRLGSPSTVTRGIRSGLASTVTDSFSFANSVLDRMEAGGLGLKHVFSVYSPRSLDPSPSKSALFLGLCRH
jgi:hypothetical protein